MNESAADIARPRRRRRRPAAPRASGQRTHYEEIVLALGRLDGLLEAAIETFEANHGGAVSDRFRGLYISRSDAHGLLHSSVQDQRLRSVLAAPVSLWPAAEGTLAERFVRLFGLEQFELDALLIAFAPEFDLRYERLYAYLQDDVTRRRPTVNLILSLLCAAETERLARRGTFASNSALIRNAVANLVTDPNQVHPPLLAQYLKPDEQIVRFILNDSGLDSRLAGCCTVVQPVAAISDLAVSTDARQQLTRFGREAAGSTSAQCLWLHGPAGTGKSRAAEAIACEAGASLLALDASRVEPGQMEATMRLAVREAWFRRAWLYISRAESWLVEPQGEVRLADVTRVAACTTIFGSKDSLPAAMLGVALSLTFPVPGAAVRGQCWRRALAQHGASLDEGIVVALASRFRLTPAQISSAVSDAIRRGTARPAAAPDYLAAARAQSGQALTALANRIEPRATSNDIVLPPDAVAQLGELCQRVDQREHVFGDWGFGRKLSRGRGTTALFSGGSGTGKTMAAEVIANALGLELYRIDLARVVSKYIGETEKNLERVFTAAECANAILFFDEAEALFGKRSEVKDAHDRYANIEIAYLLQKMEVYDGVTILATNLADSLDDAMARRLAFHVNFPFPDETSRLRIWERAWPAEVPVASEVDRHALARELKLSGGNIRNVALGAAFLAAGNGGVVEPVHVARAVRREQQKCGRAAEELET